MVHKIQYSNNDDVTRIIKVAINHGVVLSPPEAKMAWEEYSDSRCAGWLFLPDDEEDIWNSLPSWARAEENE